MWSAQKMKVTTGVLHNLEHTCILAVDTCFKSKLAWDTATQTDQQNLQFKNITARTSACAALFITNVDLGLDLCSWHQSGLCACLEPLGNTPSFEAYTRVSDADPYGGRDSAFGFR